MADLSREQLHTVRGPPAWQRFLLQVRPGWRRPSVDLGWLGRVVWIFRPETFEGPGRGSFLVDAVIKRLVAVLDSPLEVPLPQRGKSL